jgi:exodeoxyribonuclease V gamma subunit
VIRLVYSNATEELLAALADAIAEERQTAGPLEPVRVVVPNANIETYLKLGLAERAGIAANLEITFLRRFLARVAERALPPARAVDADHIEGCLLALFHDPVRLDHAELGPVRAYLGAAGESSDAVDRRRCQLAAALARLFDEYASSRPKMLAEWRAHDQRRVRGAAAAMPGDDAGSGALDERARFAATERWQRALWLAIFGAGGLLSEESARTGATYLPLGELLVEAERRLEPAGLGRALHVFGVSYVAESYHRMLALLGRHLDVRIYTLNPCREFWEDLDTAHEAARRTKRETKRLFPTRRESRQPMLTVDDDPFALAGEAEMLALRLWGRPGRENIRLLNQLTDADFEGRFRRRADEGAAPSLLHRLQDDILDRVARERPDPALAADGSIAVLPCPGLRRELEVVAAEIWRMVRADPSLRFNQIAVIVPEANRDGYLSQIGAIFGESHDLPWSGIDLPPGHGHGVGEITEVAERLIDLPLGTFTRRELLPLLTHPAILSPARFPGVAPADWINLCEDLAIVHGADHRDHHETYIHEDLFNWDQGVRRVALGALMTGPRSGDDTPVRLGERDYLPAESPAGRTAGALGFGLLVRSLIEDARFAAGVTGPRLRRLPEWLELIRGFVAAYICPADEIGATGVARTLRALSDLDDVAASLGDRAVSYRVAAELCRARLRRIGGERGQHLARGVAVASFVPMRAIPFRAIFLVGLGHGAFPSAPRRDELDLRAARRLPGDVSPREQDLYMFLETLLGARESLVLSYVARDELTGDRLEPSSVILELGDILRRGYLPAAEAQRLFDPPPIPLRRFDDDDRLDAHPPALRENRARALGRSLAAALPPDAPPPELSSLAELLPAATYHQITASLGLHRPPRAEGQAPHADASSGVTQVSLQTLRQFLEDPLQGAARFRLRMREIDSDEERVDREDEPFESERTARTLRLRAAMLSVLARAPGSNGFPWSVGGAPTLADLHAAHASLARRDELLGQIPTGFFRQAEGPAEEEILATWWDHARAVGGGWPAVGRIMRFGRAAELEPADDLRDPIVLSVSVAGAPARRLEIVGRTELVVAPANSDAPAGSLVFSCRSARRDDPRADRELLRAFLDHVALAAAGLSQGAHEALLAVASGTTRPGARNALDRHRLAPVDATRARAYLETLASELLEGAHDPATGSPTGVHPYLLPHEAVFEAYRTKKNVVDVIEGMCDRYADLGRKFSSGYGPVPQAIERHLPPSADAAANMVDNRFGLLFDLLGSPAAEAAT